MNAIRLLGRLASKSLFRRRLISARAWAPQWLALACLLAPGNLHASGFVFTRDAQGNISEPQQKVIILFDQGREDMILQARYEGPAQGFGWLIPVPGVPEVRPGSLNCFHDLSRLTQVPLWPEEFNKSSLFASDSSVSPIKAVEIKTIGGFEVTVLSAQDTNSLSQWLAGHDFVLPEDKQSKLDSYVRKHGYLVAVKVDPAEKGFSSGPPPRPAVPHSAGQEPVAGELQPVLISFPSEKCVYPLSLPAGNAKPAEVSIFVLSGEPLMCRAIFERKLEANRRQMSEWIARRPAREKAWYAHTNRSAAVDLGLSGSPSRSPLDDPADPKPSPEIMVSLITTTSPLEPFFESEDDFRAGEDLVTSIEVRATDLPGCAKELPRLAGKSWWLTKQIETYEAGENHDLEFEPAVPIFAEKLHTPDGPSLGQWLPQFGARAVPLVLAGLSSSELAERRMAASAMAQMADPRLVAPIGGLLSDPDADIRANACASAMTNWDSEFAPQVVQLLSDQSSKVRAAAQFCLQDHPTESATHVAAYRKLVENGGPAASSAMGLLRFHRVQLPKESLIPFLSSTDPCTVALALWDLGDRRLELDEISPLLANSLPMARFRGLAALLQIANQEATDRIVSMLRDPHEGLRWTARTFLRRLSGRKLGADPAAWEQWWAENKKTFKPAPLVWPTSERK